MEHRPLRILSVCYSDDAGGAARAAYRIHKGVNTFSEGRIVSSMFVKKKFVPDEKVVELADVLPRHLLFRVVNYVVTKIKNKIQHARWRRYPNQDKNFKSDLRGSYIAHYLEQADYDVLHLHWISNRFLDLHDLLSADNAYRKKHHGKPLPIVWTLHDSWPFCGVCHYFLDCEGYKNECGCCPQLASADRSDLSHSIWQQKAAIYRQLDLHIVSPSRWLADSARRSGLFAPRDIRVIPNCLDTELFRPSNQEKGLAKPFILYGAMQAATDRIKGFASLLSAMQILDDKGFEAQLVVFGANRQELPMTFRHIEVTFVGYISKTSVLTDLYNAADVMVVPSLSENLSNTIMESLACGTPVVAFDIGGNRDMIDHQVNGYIAAEADPEDLANGIRWCMDNNTDRHLSENARQKVITNFTPNIISKKYTDLYQQIYGNSVLKP